MLPVSVDALTHWIAGRRFNSKTIASHSLRFGGHVAGAIDECQKGRIRGWVYDAQRADDVIRLEVCVDGNPVAQIDANVYRDDLAQLLDDNGIHGFDATVGALRQLGDAQAVTVRLADSPKYFLGPVEAKQQTAAQESSGSVSLIEQSDSDRTGRRDSANKLGDMAADDVGPPRSNGTDVSAVTVSQDLDFRLQHIFDHITAAHEDNLRRLDKLETDISQIKTLQDSLLRSMTSRDSTSLLIYNAPKSSIAGIGAFRTPANSDESEIPIVRARIEQALLKARSGGSAAARSA